MDLVTSSGSSSDSDPDGDETLQSLVTRLEQMSPTQAGRWESLTVQVTCMPPAFLFEWGPLG
jgi:hypothetical protein